jgi:hypothetical protein
MLNTRWVPGSQNVDYKEYYLVGCDAVYFVRSLWSFRKNVLASSSGSVSCLYLQGRNRKSARSKQIIVGCLLNLFFDPEDGGSTSLRNIGKFTRPHVTTRQYSSVLQIQNVEANSTAFTNVSCRHRVIAVFCHDAEEYVS